MCILCFVYVQSFSQKNKLIFFDEFDVSINSSLSYNFNRKIGFSSGVYFKPIKKEEINLLVGIKYLNVSLDVSNQGTGKYDEIKNGKYQFHFLCFPLQVRHIIPELKLFFEYGIKLDYDIGSFHSFLGQKDKLNLFITPSIILGIGYGIKVGDGDIVIKYGVNWSPVIVKNIVTNEKITYRNVGFSLGYMF